MRLEKVSTLGKYKVNLSNINLNKVMGGDHLTLPCTLSKNENRVVRALANSRANNLAFLNTRVTYDLTFYYNTSLKSLPRSIRVKGYKGKIETAVT